MDTKEDLKEGIYKGLQEIVERFNSDYCMWCATSACEANFSWRYGMDGKYLNIDKITMQVYEDVISREEQVQEAQRIMSEAATTKVSPV